MTIRKHAVLILAMLALVIVPLPVLAATNDIRYENYTAGEDDTVDVHDSSWIAQTFTTNESFELDKIRLKLSVKSSPGVFTGSIRTTNATGYPNGIDITSCEVPCESIGETLAWHTGDLDNIVLAANTTYAFIGRAVANSTAGEKYEVAQDGSSAAYAGGSEFTSTDGGYTWVEDTDDDFLFELWGTPVIETKGAAVYQSYYATGDWLITASYKNVYEPYYPVDDPQSHFLMQLLSGSTVIAQTNVPQWGYKPVGIYMSADAVSSLSWGSAYIIRMIGLDAPYSSTSYTLTAADWKGSDLLVLDSWCIATARGMEEYYDETFVELTSEKGEVLNEEAGVMFDTGIPGLATQRGETLFQVSTSGIPYEEGEWTASITGSTNEWYTQFGPDISTLVNETADLVDSDGKTLLIIGLLGIYMVAAVIMIANGLNAGAFAVLAPFLMFGYVAKILPWPAIGVSLAILVMLAMRQLWWKST